MNDRDGITMPEPLGYLLTWSTYGTWLPGDERGWVKRGEGVQLPDQPLELGSKARMTEGDYQLDQAGRQVVEQTIAAHCRVRCWILHAINCRSNHIHVVVTASQHP
ncbi:MAG TPA: hypothetical protein VGG30_11545, partial [Pirellulales bacterium]